MIFVPLSSPASRPPSGRGLTALRTSGSGVPHPRQVIGGGRQGHLDRHCLQSSASELPHPTLSFQHAKDGFDPPQRGRGLWPHLFTVQHYVKVPASSHVPICHLSSVFRNAGVDLVGPGEDSTLQVLDLAEPGLHQQFHGLRASHSGAAMDYDFIRRVEFVHALRNFG